MNKKTYMFVIGLLFLGINCSTVYAGNCSVKADPNGYCDAEGGYSDPSMSDIKNYGCSQYTKKINNYCTSRCREDVKTHFPTNVPFVTVDQYDSILGGNHFRWEEITMKFTEECETTIDYNKWEKDYNAVISGSGTTVAGIIRHIVREEHQRLTDVSVCDFWDYYEGINTKNRGITNNEKYEATTQQFYRTLSASKKAEFAMHLTMTFKWKSNCDRCNATVVDSSKKYQVVMENMLLSWGHCPDDLSNALQIPDRKAEATNAIIQINNDTGIKSSIYDYGWTKSQYEGLQKSCVYAVCVSPNGKLSKPDPETGKCFLSGEDYHVYDQVLFENFESMQTGTTQGPNSYCGKPTYNTTDFDIDIPNVVENNGSYAVTWQKLNNEVKNLLRDLKNCNKGNVTNKNNTKVVVNYKDNPSKTYSRDVTLNKKVVSKNDTGLQKTQVSWANQGMNWTECINYTKQDINNMIKESLRTGKVPTTICPVSKKLYDDTGDYLPKYMNTRVYQQVTTDYKFEMPKNTYNYILKETGEAVDSTSSKVTQNVKDNYRYIDIGYPNYPVHYTTPTGTYPISLTYTNLGKNNHFVKSANYSCEYKVINRIIPCPEGECPIPDPDTHCTPGTPNCPGGGEGINVIYRPISLVDPFPDYTAKGRTPGENWSNKDVQDYIINNRGVKSNQVYNKAPLYTFTLDAKAIRAIKNYNNSKDSETHKKREYNDFNLTCSSQKNGKRCMSKFLKNIKTMIGNSNASGKCLGASSGNFYRCADKPNQDKIKCIVNKSNKLECYDCNLAANKDKAVCKGSGQ